MSLTEVLENLGNTTPSLSLIASLIVGASVIVAGVACKKNLLNPIVQDADCNKLQYAGGIAIIVGVVLFYFAQDYNLAMYEGLWLIALSVVSAVTLYKVNV